MISKNKSLTTISRGIQQSHIRRYDSGKVIQVNKNVKKKEVKLAPRETYRQSQFNRNIVPIQPKEISRPVIQLKPRPPRDPLGLIKNKEQFRRTLLENASFNDNVWKWVTKNQDELVDHFWEEWLDYVEEQPKSEDLNKLFEAFLENELYFNSWDDLWGGKDKVYVEFVGDFSKIKDGDPVLFKTAQDSDSYNEFSYFMDPFNDVVLKNSNEGYSLGLNEQHLEEILESTPGILEDYRMDSIENKVDKYILDELIKEKIPFVLTENSYNSAISVPKQFKEQAQDILKRINSAQKQ